MSDLVDWLQIHQACHYAPQLVLRTLGELSPREWLDRAKHQSNPFRLNEKWQAACRQLNEKVITGSLNWLERADCHIILYHDTDYPVLLREISVPPLLLFVEGQRNCLSSPQIAVVGSRYPSHDGSMRATSWSKEIAQAQFTVTSGLAMGIDAAAHCGALSAPGHTIAVLGQGFPKIYPKRHEALAAEIVKRGAVISEFPWDAEIKPFHFPIRNRLISGLSLGTVVIEAKSKSGSLITAYAAVEQGREVFAVPGAVGNPLSQGCHELIQQGAKLVTHIDEVLEEFKPIECKTRKQNKELSFAHLDPRSLKLLECVGYEITHFDVLVERLGWAASDVTVGLVTLELEGFVQQTLGGYQRIR